MQRFEVKRCVPAWCALDTKLGYVTVSIDEECLVSWAYGQNLGGGFLADEKINIGLTVLQALLREWQLARCIEKLVRGKERGEGKIEEKKEREKRKGKGREKGREKERKKEKKKEKRKKEKRKKKRRKKKDKKKEKKKEKGGVSFFIIIWGTLSFHHIVIFYVPVFTCFIF